MPRLKMFCVLPRLKDVSSQWFHDHWRHPHGTLGRTISTVRNYVQSHQIPSALLGPDQATYEGVVEVWFDSVTDARALPEHPDYLRNLVPDEPTFIDMDGIRFIFTEEEILYSGPDPREDFDEAALAWAEAGRPTSIKLIQLVVEGDPAAWYSDNDVELGRRIGALRHTRCIPMADLHAEGAAFVGVRELWWATVSDFEAGVMGDRKAFKALTGKAINSITLLCHAERFK